MFTRETFRSSTPASSKMFNQAVDPVLRETRFFNRALTPEREAKGTMSKERQSEQLPLRRAASTLLSFREEP